MTINNQNLTAPCLCQIVETRGAGVQEYNALGRIVLDGGQLKRRITLEWHFADIKDALRIRAALTGSFEEVTDAARGLNGVLCYAESIGLNAAARSCTLRLVLKER